MNIVVRMQALAQAGAEWVLWVLVALSVFGLAIAIERAVFFVSSRDDVARLRAELRKLLGTGDLTRARHRLSESPSFEARIAAAALSADALDAAEQRMQGEIGMARLSMERNLAFLGTLGNNAPFIGLLGTVIGVVRSFRALEGSHGQISAGLMTEVGEALIATAVGLLVALPAIAAFNLFQRLIRARLARAEALGREVLAYLGSSSGGPVSAE